MYALIYNVNEAVVKTSQFEFYIDTLIKEYWLFYVNS